jgi:hypothetical protein
MGGTAAVPTDLQRRREQAARDFVERNGYREVRNISLLPDDTEALRARSVHVQMPMVQFTYWDDATGGRRRGEISAVGLEVPLREADQ